MVILTTVSDNPDFGYSELLLPVLVYLQTHLDSDLSLESVARQADMSPYHFHRIFQAAVGETLKQYTQRLRLERAAYQLKIQDASILDVALGVGFHSHETFSRAFKRWSGTTPQEFRDAHGHLRAPQPGRGQSLNQYAIHYELSQVRVRKLHPISVAYLRHTGPYLAVGVHLFDTLITWAESRGLYHGDNLLIGIGHDSPATTPADRLRFDACLEVPAGAQAEGDIGTQVIPPGYYAVTTYIGPYGRTLEQAYHTIFQRLSQLEEYDIIGLPAVEIYCTTHLDPDYELNHTDIYIPVRKR